MGQPSESQPRGSQVSGMQQCCCQGAGWYVPWHRVHNPIGINPIGIIPCSRSVNRLRRGWRAEHSHGDCAAVLSTKGTVSKVLSSPTGWAWGCMFGCVGDGVAAPPTSPLHHPSSCTVLCTHQRTHCAQQHLLPSAPTPSGQLSLGFSAQGMPCENHCSELDQALSCHRRGLRCAPPPCSPSPSFSSIFHSSCFLHKPGVSGDSSQMFSAAHHIAFLMKYSCSLAALLAMKAFGSSQPWKPWAGSALPLTAAQHASSLRAHPPPLRAEWVMPS